jgi:hypothetical protein
MKNYLKIVYLICLFSGMFMSCQHLQDILPEIKPPSEEQKNKFGAFLTGSEEVPAVDAPGSGAAFFELVDGGTAMKYELRVTNTQDIVAAHIHLAPFGENGGVVVNLNPTSSSNGVIAQGKFTAENFVGTLDGRDLDDLIDAMKGGTAYVNVHTAQNPGGEIRGQVSVIKSNKNGIFKTHLDGDQEVPTNSSNAKGVANFKFNSDHSKLSFKVNVAKLEDVRAAHIHIGKSGVNGPVVVTLRGDKVLGEVNGLYAEGIIRNEDLTSLLSGGDLIILREAIRTGNAYVNVHTDDYPGGEIRGQL